MHMQRPLTAEERESSRNIRNFAIVLTVFGVIAPGFIYWSVYGTLRSRSWPAVWGTVVSSEVSSYQGWRPAIRYTYTVDGVEYAGTRYSLDGIGWGEERAEAEAAKFRVGEPVEVGYDSHSPDQSVLIRGFADPAWNFYGAIVFSFFMGPIPAALVWSVVWLRSRGRLLQYHFEEGNGGHGCDHI
jgi:Protein of unknown function (DUF3592)